MNYEEIEIDSIGGIQTHIVITNEDGSSKSFPADATNPEYAVWLEAQTPKTTSKVAAN